MIPVTKPFLPPAKDYQLLVKEIWERQWLTNNGPFVNELELKIKEYLKLPHMLYLANGTLALQIAIKALDLKGEIITTPFSYVATTSSILWEGCRPVFVDIEENTFNIDPFKIEAAITPQTTAILATHVFGNPCDIDAIELIAQKHNLKVIYDAAHCFGTLYKGKSVFTYGDISTTSFHATKLFHTVEGGAVFCNNSELVYKMSWLRNFGHCGPEKFEGVGINAKNSEFHAAMGLVNLKYVSKILGKRKSLSQYYHERLEGLAVQYQTLHKDAAFNYAYLPVVFETEAILLNMQKALNAHNIFPRRYFYPSLNKAQLTTETCMPISESIATRILCLPLYYTLTKAEIDFICRILLRTQNNA